MSATARKTPRSRGRRHEDHEPRERPVLLPEERLAARITNGLKLAVGIVTGIVFFVCAGIGGYMIVMLKWKEAANLLK